MTTISHPFDILLRGLPVVFCGINPSPRTAETGHNFGSPSNRFWRALHLSGFTPHPFDAEEDRLLLRFGCGITAAALRPTRSASDISREEMKASKMHFLGKMALYSPNTIAFLGKQAFSAFSDTSLVEWGRQSLDIAGSATWVLPNPSGLNRAFPLDRLVEHYAALRIALSAPLQDWQSAVEKRPENLNPHSSSDDHPHQVDLPAGYRH